MTAGTPTSSRRGGAKRPGGFTLLEMLVATAVFALVVALLLSTLNYTSSVWRKGTDSIGAFQSARFAFDTITRSLGRAVLNVYWDYDFDADGKPERYLRQSELQFVIEEPGALSPEDTGNAIFFQAPAGHATSDLEGLDGLLNAVGYYIVYGPDPDRPDFMPDGGNRFRLMQFLEPAEEFSVYAGGNGSDEPGDGWRSDARLEAHSTVIAENVFFLLFWPRMSEQDDPEGNLLSADFAYDSRADWDADPQPATANQLPPLVQVTLIAMDEASATRLEDNENVPEVISGAVDGLFEESTYESYEADMEELIRQLGDAGINARSFSAVVPLRESKWSPTW